jgi:hypothetical protein
MNNPKNSEEYPTCYLLPVYSGPSLYRKSLPMHTSVLIKVNSIQPFTTFIRTLLPHKENLRCPIPLIEVASQATSIIFLIISLPDHTRPSTAIWPFPDADNLIHNSSYQSDITWDSTIIIIKPQTI